MKRCTSCGVEKPLDAFYARKAGKGGKSAECKACARAYHKAWRERSPDRLATYRERHEDSQRRAHRSYRERNPEKVQAWSKAAKERVKADPIRLAEKREMDKRWRRENPEKFRAQRAVQNHRRREARVARREDEAVRDYVLVLHRDPCCYCGAPTDEIDHIVSHSAGGPTVWDNLTAACQTCNRKKRNDSLLRFLAA